MTEIFTVLAEEPEDGRDLLREIADLLDEDGTWRTPKEIAAPKSGDGIGANVDTVKKVLTDHLERFVSRTGEAAKEVGRSKTATVWQKADKVTQPFESPASPLVSRELTMKVTH